VFGSWNAANMFLSVPDISSAADAARDIIALLRETNTSAAEKSLPALDEKPRTVDGHLSLRNVSFRYPSRPEALILDNLTVDIPKGAHIAFVGPSGSGKSTM
jgi:ATP-binding cassette subfamily B (MDR/TAP) protein 1